MKKEKNPVSTAPPLQPIKSVNSLALAVTALAKEGAESSPPPTIKSDPDGGPPSVPAVNGDNATGCDKASPPPAGGEGEAREDKKPPMTPNDCAGVVKSETDSFLDSFDTKDGGKTQIIGYGRKS